MSLQCVWALLGSTHLTLFIIIFFTLLASQMASRLWDLLCSLWSLDQVDLCSLEVHKTDMSRTSVDFFFFNWSSFIGDQLNILILLSFAHFHFIDDINKGLIWGYWTSSMIYGQNAILFNDFLGRNWRHVIFIKELHKLLDCFSLAIV